VFGHESGLGGSMFTLGVCALDVQPL